MQNRADSLKTFVSKTLLASADQCPPRHPLRGKNVVTNHAFDALSDHRSAIDELAPLANDASLQLLLRLGDSQEGASAVFDYLQSAQRIRADDNESWHWHQELRQRADASRIRANLALMEGCIQTARSNWLRALSFLRAAEYPLDEYDGRRKELRAQVEECSRLYVEHMSPRGEIVEIPSENGNQLSAFFLAASSDQGRAPAVICLSGADNTKDDQLYKISRYGLNRGMSLLLVDLPDPLAVSDPVTSRCDADLAVSYCMDYLLSRDDVDETRIALYGDGVGGAHASRVVSIDHRFAAAVCDGGLWDQQERDFFLEWFFGSEDINSVKGTHRKLGSHSVALKITCPILVTVSRRDPVRAHDAIDLYNACKEAGLPVELKVFAEEAVAECQGQIDNPIIEKEFIFDWIGKKISTVVPA